MSSVLLPHLRSYLAAQGVARAPRTAGATPPLWLDPQDGVPAPGEGENPTERGPDVVLGAYITGGVPMPQMAAQTRKDVVDIHIRARASPLVFTTGEQLRGALVGKGSPAAQFAWDMAGLTIVSSLEWRPLQRIASDPQGFTYLLSFIFETYAL